MRYQQNEANATINGVSNDYFDVKGLVFKDGQTFDQRSVRDRSQDVVIDTNTQKQFLVTVPTLSVKSYCSVVYLLVLLAL